MEKTGDLGSSSVLNVRIDKQTKAVLQEIANLKGETLSSLTAKAIDQLVDDEFDYQLAREIVGKIKKGDIRRPISELKRKYGITRERK